MAAEREDDGGYWVRDSWRASVCVDRFDEDVSFFISTPAANMSIRLSADKARDIAAAILAVVADEKVTL